MGLGITNQQLGLSILQIPCPADILLKVLKHAKFFVLLLKACSSIGSKCTPGLEDFNFCMTVILYLSSNS